MNFKKLVSAASALTIAVSAFAGLAVTASAFTGVSGPLTYGSDSWIINTSGTGFLADYTDRNNVVKSAVGVDGAGGSGNRAASTTFSAATTADEVVVDAYIVLQAGNNGGSESHYSITDQDGAAIVTIASVGNNAVDTTITDGAGNVLENVTTIMGTKIADSVLGNGTSAYFQSPWTEVKATLNFADHTGKLAVGSNSYNITLAESSTGVKGLALQGGRGFGAALIADYTVEESAAPTVYAEELTINYVDESSAAIQAPTVIDISAYEVLAGATYSYAYPKYIVSGNTLYQVTAEACIANAVINEKNVTENVVYAEVGTGTYQFFEYDGSYTTRNTTSNGSAGAANGGVSVTVEADGVYTVTANGYGGAGNRSLSVYKGSADGVLLASETLTIYAGGTDVTATDVELKAGDVIYIVGSASTAYLDYVLLTKTGELSVEPTTINATNAGVFNGTDGSVATAFKAELNGATGTLNFAVTSNGNTKTFNSATTVTDADVVLGIIISGLSDAAATGVLTIE